MIDIQSQKDSRNIPIDHVGVRNVLTPFNFSGKKNKKQSVTASVNLYADLLPEIKGHHLSRFIELIHNNRNNILSSSSLSLTTKKAQKKLESEKVRIEVYFTLFIPKKSPKSKKYSFANYACGLISERSGKNEKQYMVVNAEVMLLCPCSKAISKYNAHNQRANIKAEVEFEGNIFMEDLIDIINKEGSAEIFPLLKRIDEKYVTETSYENPKFVEDVVRDLAIKIGKIKQIKGFSIEVESYESIHHHNAYAKYLSEAKS